MNREQVYRQLTVSAVIAEVAGVKTIWVRNQDGTPLQFTPGQFITLVFTHRGKEERRSFSISKAEDGQLAFTVKRIDNGAYSRLLADRLQAGDALMTTGVAGLFTLPHNLDAVAQLWFFAAGIGITPIVALIEATLHNYPGKKVTLIYSNRNKPEVVFYERLIALQDRYPHFAIEFLFSDAYNLQRARLNKALVRTLLREYSQTTTDKMLFYVCGPHDYMRMVIYALEENGIKDAQIRREHFSMNARPAVMAQPPDTALHKVTIITDKGSQTIDCAYPDTILAAAKKKGIALPYSCEVGRCGSCAALCMSGTVWHSYNEVLMDMDLKHGSILTCTGHPVNGDITIRI